MRENDVILEVKDLRLDFRTYRGRVKALNGVYLKLFKGEVLGLVGESGCGKSVTALSTINLLTENAEILGGQILLNGTNLLEKSKYQIRDIRAKEIASVFQDPMTFLNPVLTIKTQLEETFKLNMDGLKHAATVQQNKGKNITYLDYLALKEQSLSKHQENEKVSRGEIKKILKTLCVDVLRIVKLPDPERILREYPFALSGGMRQRCMIAMALARRPSIFIADEITTAVDVTIQAQILHLMRELRSVIEASTLLITHDLSVAAEIADRVAVMYGGNVVEVSSTRSIFKEPLHPYTQMLMKAIPDIAKPVKRLESIPGIVPDLIDPPSGCRFHPRCPHVMPVCKEKFPNTKDVRKNHEVACYLY
ncbi:MAG: ABC transporter ATP-binding protein [Candidatus Bathyarchaeota archaeon]|nr:MAG: ABC transporter ATP-binding protein [Candidatus Bathyarchaeota archaeon]